MMHQDVEFAHPVAKRKSSLMKLHYKYDTNTVAKTVLLDYLEKYGIPYDHAAIGHIDLRNELTTSQLELLNNALQKYGIQIIGNQENILVQKVKDAIREIAGSEGILTNANMSDYLSHRFNQSYSNIARIFSDVTLTSIERFYILHRIERVKDLMSGGDMTLTEISWQLGFSSVQHLSNQFKKITGITPTQFQRILRKRRSNSAQQ